MKVDTEDFTGHWTESLSIRIQLPIPSDPDGTQASDTDSEAEETFEAPLHGCLFTSHSPASLMALRNLPAQAPLVLFTPFLVPVGSSTSTSEEPQRRDPFETLGRHLAKHHPNICHVPYIPSIGFTETHLEFVMESEAVITVVCEPSHALKRGSVMEQHDFAETALKAFNSRAMTVPGDGEFVLVQCSTDAARRPAQSSFANVVETRFYNERSAVFLVDNIFGHA